MKQGDSTAIIRSVLGGTEEVVCHSGTHQYSDGGIFGVSACGLAALNFARVIFEIERQHGGCGRDEDLLQSIIAKETVQNITDICAGWSSDLHLEVDDIRRVPLFDQTLKLVSTKFDQPGLSQFTTLLQELQDIHTTAVVIITRPPEIIACLKLILDDKNIFVIFDSHARPSHPVGAGFILNTSIHSTAARLNEILPVDSRLLSDSGLQWQAQLLANYSGHIFVSRRSVNDLAQLMQTIVESSLTILALRAQNSNLTSQNATLTSDSKRLEAEMEKMEEEHHEERRRILQSSGSHKSSSYHTSGQGGGDVAGLGVALRHCNWPLENSQHVDWSSASSSDDHHKRLFEQSDDFALAIQMLDSERHNMEAAKHSQQAFDEEDRRLRAQMEELAKNTQRQFQCGVCLEEQPEDSVARLEPCGHCFCRGCIRCYVSSKISENRYPVLCPVCIVDNTEGNSGVVTNSLVQQIGISEKQYETWVELEMVEFSVLLHCSKCKRSAFVDRQDLEETTTLVCPLPECDHVWCKACQRSIGLDGPQHSCDGSSELDHLMRERGWKYCPSCKTPFQKEAGCNHMTCMSPGCNTHFCYICGEAIIQSALRRDVEAATTNHYRRCRLFEDVADNGVLL